MATTTQPVFAIQRAGDRAFFDFGWLKTNHSFSFGDYYDPVNANWGALRVFNDDTVLPGQGFGTHPHRDMEIVTYVLRGELEHKDSLGHEGVVAPGGIQYISAGTGVRHSEFNHSRENDVHFVQMWVVPRKTGETPNYGQQSFTEDERRNRWLVAASGEDAVEAPVRLRQDATLRVARLENGTLEYAFDPSRYGFLFVANGDVRANGERLSAGDAVRIHGVDGVEIAGSGEVVLWDVPPSDVPRRTREHDRLRARGARQASAAAHARRLRRMPADGRRVGSSTAVPGMRPRRLLRLLEEHACDETLSCDDAPGDRLVGTGRAVEMVLRRRGHVGIA